MIEKGGGYGPGPPKISTYIAKVELVTLYLTDGSNIEMGVICMRGKGNTTEHASLGLWEGATMPCATVSKRYIVYAPTSGLS
jgi:hypothetical protein